MRRSQHLIHATGWSPPAPIVRSGPNRGRLPLATGTAIDVRFDGDERLRLSADGACGSPLEALERSWGFAGNLRFGLFLRRTSLVADLPRDVDADGLAHVARAFEAALAGIPQAVEPADLNEALSELVKRLGDAAVVLANGFELRPRIQGTVVPVRAEGIRLANKDKTLRLRTPLAFEGRAAGSLLELAPAVRNAVVDFALRRNLDVRFARLALDADRRLVAEACLAAKDWNVERVLDTARAVAVLCHGSRDLVRLLTEQDAVAEEYAAALLSYHND